MLYIPDGGISCDVSICFGILFGHICDLLGKVHICICDVNKDIQCRCGELFVCLL